MMVDIAVPAGIAAVVLTACAMRNIPPPFRLIAEAVILLALESKEEAPVKIEPKVVLGAVLAGLLREIEPASSGTRDALDEV